MAGLVSRTVFDAVKSHALTTGLFRSVATHEPKNAPANGPHMALYVSGIRPIDSSGLNSTSALVVITGRIYLDIELTEPHDEVDPDLVAATDTYMGKLIGDYTLGGNVRAVDVRGGEGTPLQAQAGYITIDQTTFRSMDITIPVLINDAWTEAA